MKPEEANQTPDSDEYRLADLDPTLVKSTQSADPAVIPVPAVPVHTCATCDYNLTGLLSRRCPECGTPFSIASGRNVTIIPTSERDDHRAILFARIKFCVGLLALTAGIVAPWVDRSGQLTGIRGTAVSIVNLFFLKHLIDYKIASSQTWSEWLFRTGLMTAALSGMVMLVF